MFKPKLIENNTYQFLNQSLQECHIKRHVIYSYILNIAVFLLLSIGLYLVLYYSYKNKLTPQQREIKKLKEQDYILTKIRQYQEDQKNIRRMGEIITTLPIIDDTMIPYSHL